MRVREAPPATLSEVAASRRGIVPNTGADLSARIQAAIAFCAERDLTLVFDQPGDYRISSPVTFTASGDNQIVSVRGVPGARLMRWGANAIVTLDMGVSASALVSSKSVVDTNAFPTEPCLALGSGGTSHTVHRLTFASPVATLFPLLDRGDNLKLVSDDLLPDGNDGANERSGQWATFIKVDAADPNSMFLSSVLTLDGLDYGGVDYLATNLRVYHPYQNNRVIWDGLTFGWDESVGTGGSTSWGLFASLNIKWSCGSVICNLSRQKASGRGIRLLSTVGASVRDSYFGEHQNAIPTFERTGYGIEDIGTSHTRVSNCHFEDLRHGWTQNASSQATVALGGDPAFMGRTEFSHVSDCTFESCSNAGPDTHQSAIGTMISGCISTDNYPGSSSGGTGIALRGRSIMVTGCQVRNARTGVFVHVKANAQIRDCVFSGQVFGGVVQPNTETPAGTAGTETIDNVTFSDCVFEGGGGTVVQVGSATQGMSTNISFMQCQFRFRRARTSTAQDNARLLNLDRASVRMGGCEFQFAGAHNLSTGLRGIMFGSDATASYLDATVAQNYVITGGHAGISALAVTANTAHTCDLWFKWIGALPTGTNTANPLNVTSFTAPAVGVRSGARVTFTQETTPGSNAGSSSYLFAGGAAATITERAARAALPGTTALRITGTATAINNIPPGNAGTSILVTNAADASITILGTAIAVGASQRWTWNGSGYSLA